jgi:hypothetical protein
LCETVHTCRPRHLPTLLTQKILTRKMSDRLTDAAPILTLENYYSWEKKMQWHLKGRKDGTLLWSCIEESAVFTSATADERSQATALVQSVLMRTVPSILEDLVHTAASAKSAWGKIKSFFEQGMQERKAHMLREFLNLKQGSDTIPVFLLGLESKKLELREKCQYTVDDDLQMLVLCDAVRKEYSAKLDVVKLKDSYSYEDMKQALVSEDIRLRQQPTPALVPEMFYATLAVKRGTNAQTARHLRYKRMLIARSGSHQSSEVRTMLRPTVQAEAQSVSRQPALCTVNLCMIVEPPIMW